MSNYQRIFIEGYCYFLTVITHQRNPILIDNIDLLRESFRVSKTKYPFEIKAVVILADHFHLMIKPEIATDYPKIISKIKQHFSKRCNPKFYAHLKQSESRKKAGYKPIWQKKYYEHTIRDDDDYLIHLNYIHYNPVKHGHVKQPKEWKHSSFHQYVNKGFYKKEWGNFDSNIDFE